jgi:hypothetical protein
MPSGDGPLLDEGAHGPDLRSGHALDATPRVRIKRRWWVLGALMLILTVMITVWGEAGRTTGVTAPPAFCKVADRMEKEFELHGRKRVARQLTLVEDLAAVAPRRIQPDMQVYLEAMRRRVQNDRSVIDDPAIQRSVDNVNRYASQGCGVLDRQSGI